MPSITRLETLRNTSDPEGFRNLAQQQGKNPESMAIVEYDGDPNQRRIEDMGQFAAAKTVGIQNLIPTEAGVFGGRAALKFAPRVAGRIVARSPNLAGLGAGLVGGTAAALGAGAIQNWALDDETKNKAAIAQALYPKTTMAASFLPAAIFGGGAKSLYTPDKNNLVEFIKSQGLNPTATGVGGVSLKIAKAIADKAFKESPEAAAKEMQGLATKKFVPSNSAPGVQAALPPASIGASVAPAATTTAPVFGPLPANMEQQIASEVAKSLAQRSANRRLAVGMFGTGVGTDVAMQLGETAFDKAKDVLGYPTAPKPTFKERTLRAGLSGLTQAHTFKPRAAFEPLFAKAGLDNARIQAGIDRAIAAEGARKAEPLRGLSLGQTAREFAHLINAGKLTDDMRNEIMSRSSVKDFDLVKKTMVQQRMIEPDPLDLGIVTKAKAVYDAKLKGVKGADYPDMGIHDANVKKLLSQGKQPEEILDALGKVRYVKGKEVGLPEAQTVDEISGAKTLAEQRLEKKLAGMSDQEKWDADYESLQTQIKDLQENIDRTKALIDNPVSETQRNLALEHNKMLMYRMSAAIKAQTELISRMGITGVKTDISPAATLAKSVQVNPANTFKPPKGPQNANQVERPVAPAGGKPPGNVPPVGEGDAPKVQGTPEQGGASAKVPDKKVAVKPGMIKEASIEERWNASSIEQRLNAAGLPEEAANLVANPWNKQPLSLKNGILKDPERKKALAASANALTGEGGDPNAQVQGKEALTSIDQTGQPEVTPKAAQPRNRPVGPRTPMNPRFQPKPTSNPELATLRTEFDEFVRNRAASEAPPVYRPSSLGAGLGSLQDILGHGIRMIGYHGRRLIPAKAGPSVAGPLAEGPVTSGVPKRAPVGAAKFPVTTRRIPMLPVNESPEVAATLRTGERKPVRERAELEEPVPKELGNLEMDLAYIDVPANRKGPQMYSRLKILADKARALLEFGSKNGFDHPVFTRWWPEWRSRIERDIPNELSAPREQEGGTSVQRSRKEVEHLRAMSNWYSLKEALKFSPEKADINRRTALLEQLADNPEISKEDKEFVQQFYTYEGDNKAKIDELQAKYFTLLSSADDSTDAPDFKAAYENAAAKTKVQLDDLLSQRTKARRILYGQRMANPDEALPTTEEAVNRLFEPEVDTDAQGEPLPTSRLEESETTRPSDITQSSAEDESAGMTDSDVISSVVGGEREGANLGISVDELAPKRSPEEVQAIMETHRAALMDAFNSDKLPILAANINKPWAQKTFRRILDLVDRVASGVDISSDMEMGGTLRTAVGRVKELVNNLDSTSKPLVNAEIDEVLKLFGINKIGRDYGYSKPSISEQIAARRQEQAPEFTSSKEDATILKGGQPTIASEIGAERAGILNVERSGPRTVRTGTDANGNPILTSEPSSISFDVTLAKPVNLSGPEGTERVKSLPVTLFETKQDDGTYRYRLKSIGSKNYMQEDGTYPILGTDKWSVITVVRDQMRSEGFLKADHLKGKTAPYKWEPPVNELPRFTKRTGFVSGGPAKKEYVPGEEAGMITKPEKFLSRFAFKFGSDERKPAAEGSRFRLGNKEESTFVPPVYPSDEEISTAIGTYRDLNKKKIEARKLGKVNSAEHYTDAMVDMEGEWRRKGVNLRTGQKLKPGESFDLYARPGKFSGGARLDRSAMNPKFKPVEATGPRAEELNALRKEFDDYLRANPKGSGTPSLGARMAGNVGFMGTGAVHELFTDVMKGAGKGIKYGMDHFPGLPDVLDRVRRSTAFGPQAKKYLVNFWHLLDKSFNKYENMQQVHYNEAAEALKGVADKRAFSDQLMAYADDVRHYGMSEEDNRARMSPLMRKVYDLNQLGSGTVHTEQRRLGKLINGRDPIDAPGWLTQAIDEKVYKAAEKNTPELEKYHDDWVKWYTEDVSEPFRMTTDEAEAIYSHIIKGEEKIDLNNINESINTYFKPMERALGAGLPPSWRATIDVAMSKYARRSALSLAMWEHLQNPEDPTAQVVARLFGGGKEVSYPETGEPVEIINKTNKELKGLLRAVESKIGVPAGHLDRYGAPITAAVLTGKATLNDFATSLSIPAEVIPIAKLPGMVARHLSKALAGESGAEAAGAFKMRRTASMITDVSGESKPEALAHTLMKWGGRDLSERTSREMLFGMGQELYDTMHTTPEGQRALSRLYGGDEWKALPKSEHRDMFGKIFTEYAQGGYGAAGLPAWQLRGREGDTVLRPLTTLARWSIERSNNWKRVVIGALAEEGDPIPLIKSLTGAALTTMGMNAVLGAIFTSLKPNDLSFTEWLGLDDKDYISYLSRNAAQAGMAGIIGKFMNMGLQLGTARGIAGVENQVLASPPIEFLRTTIDRVLQASDAIRNDGRKFFDILEAGAKDFAKNTSGIGRIILGNEEIPGDRERRIYDKYYTEKQRTTAQNPRPNPFSFRKEMEKSGQPPELEAVQTYTQKHGQLPRFGKRTEDYDYYRWLSQIKGEPEAHKMNRFDRQYDQYHQDLTDYWKSDPQIQAILDAEKAKKTEKEQRLEEWEAR